jgi:Fe-S cluster assembly ATP-binding protein
VDGGVFVMSKLIIKDLHVNVDDINILKGLNLEINGGEVHALIGPNGHGKSTLLSTIMGHPRYKVTSGSILLDDQDVLKMSVDERSKAGLFLAMQYPLEISGVSNLDFLKSAINAHQEKPVSLYKFIKDFENCSKEVGFNIDMASRHLNEGFSGGEKKRNEILQMKLLNPSLALIDEIDSGLDVDGLEMIAKSINSMLDGKFSCLIISHYSKLYKLIKPTHVHIIVDGRIVTSGDHSLIERVDSEGYKWIEKEFGVSINKENKKVMLGTCNVKESVING